MKTLRLIFNFGLLFIFSVACENSAESGDFEPTVYVRETDGNFELIRNGKPFYMKGGAAIPLFLEELKEAGGNTARIYDTINLQRTLDIAETLGLAVVVDIPMPQFNEDPEFYENPELFEKLKQRVERVVKKHEGHPALLY